MKILNLYAGIGGNRKLWGNEHEVTAVENYDPAADVYAHLWPQDTLVRGDAHQYLLDHYKEFDFIWASPPCPTHSILNIPLHANGVIRYPDMRLYQEIIFLMQWGGRDGRKWVVENVTPYYKPLITPRTVIDRHFIWANFHINVMHIPSIGNRHNMTSKQLGEALEIALPDFTKPKDRRLMLRDTTDPNIGAHILKSALRETKQETLL
jgi:DNA (cytosine-5)-methyltransferase 1